MSFSGGRASSSSVLYSSLVVLLVIVSVLHLWVFCENGVGATRVFPGSRVALEQENDQPMKSNVNQTEIFRKYFMKRISDLKSAGSISAGSIAASSPNGTFQESKRRVTSCPDPLHN